VVKLQKRFVWPATGGTPQPATESKQTRASPFLRQSVNRRTR